VDVLESPEYLNARYHLGDPLGQGNMAVVYRAHDDLLGRDVAIKFLAPG
jgi:serine/threonine protein kinase